MSDISTPQRRRFARILMHKSVWIPLAILAFVGTYLYFEKPFLSRPIEVSVEVVRLGPISQVLAVNGRVASRQTVNIRSLVTAQAIEVAAGEGDGVVSGDLLVRLDTSQPKALVDQAQAALDAGIVQQQQAQANFDRAKALEQYATRAAREDAELSLAAASDNVARLKASLKQAQNQLALYAIKAPITGVVLNSNVEQGQLVDTQTALFTIADLDQLVVETDVDEIYSSRIHQGLQALLKPAGDSVAYNGTVSFAAPSVDPSTGGRAVKVAFDQPVDLPVGLTVNVNIIVTATDSDISIPRGAIITAGSQSHVLVVEDGAVAKRTIVFDDWPAERVKVTAGLAPGDNVILDPASVTAGQAAAAR